MGLGIVINTISIDDEGNASITAGVLRPIFNQDDLVNIRPKNELDSMQAQHDTRQLMYLNLHLGGAQLN